MEIFLYAFVIMIHLFLPCYYGSNISAASENLSWSLFHSTWTQANRKQKAAVKIFIENSKGNLVVTALGFMKIDFAIFTRICNSAYSLYALLNEIAARL